VRAPAFSGQPAYGSTGNLVDRQSALQREAAEVLRDLRVEETLGTAGRTVAVGSFVTGLMVWRDLDVVVGAAGLTTAGAFEVMYPLLARSHAARYENDTELERHYFVLGIPWRDELRERLTGETRLAILTLRTPGIRKRRTRTSSAGWRSATPS
jgi:hypothetical protein